MVELRHDIRRFIENAVSHYREPQYFRKPLVAFAPIDDPKFEEIKNISGERYSAPSELMPGGVTVASFFLPFSAEVVESNRGDGVSSVWAEANLHADMLIEFITGSLLDYLSARYGFEGMTVRFLETCAPDFTAENTWSNHGAAYAVGFGQFGINRQIITDMGCSGRFGSIIFDGTVIFIEKKAETRCLGKIDGSCTYCIDVCPVGALSADGFDSGKCRAYLERNASGFADGEGLKLICGKCATGPCATLVSRHGEIVSVFEE